MKATSAVATVLLALAVVLSYVTGSTAAHPAPAVVGTAAVVESTVVCPVIDSSPSGTSTVATIADISGATGNRGAVVATTLAGTKSVVTPLPLPLGTVQSKAGVDSSIAVSSVGPVAASLVADQVLETSDGRYRGLASGACESPQTDWWFAGLDGRVGYSDSLVVANAATTPAEVTVSLWSKTGPVSNQHLNAIAIAAQSRTVVQLAQVAPNDAVIGMQVHAHSGAVAAAVVERRTTALSSDGGDLVPPTLAPNKAQVIAGYAKGAGNHYLYVANPGDLDATVTLKLTTGSGSFVPSGVNQFVVKSGQTRFVDLTKVFGGQTGAVQIASDQKVFAQGMASLTVTGLRPDRQWLAATDPIDGTVGVANGHEPDGGQCLLLLTAPAAAATVQVKTPAGKTTSITVPAGTSVQADIASTITNGTGSWPFSLTSTGGPVYGVRMLNFGGAHGALISAEPFTPLPKPIPLPPVRSDPKIAVK
jgi:hypothetical protein